MLCDWCHEPIPAEARVDSRFCGQKCRQTAFRLRKRGAVTGPAAGPLRIGYADPPYPGLAARYYRHELDYRGEVDHQALIRELEASYDGWALSTSARALRKLLPLCPEHVRVCAWTKPHAASPATYGPHNCWEPLLVKPARHLRPGVRDWLSALPARGGGRLPGRKPIAFCAWLFALLGMRAGDELVDIFPGTGVVGRAWVELSSVDGRRVAVAPAAATVTRRGRQLDASSTPAEHVAGGRGRRVVEALNDASERVR